jgi:hypothetical protein
MKAFAALTIFFCTAILAWSESLYQADHAFDGEDPRFKYELFLGRTVFQGYPPNAELSFYVKPSFKAQYGVWMKQTKEGYVVVSTRARRDLYSVTNDWSNLTPLDAVDLAKQVNDAKLIETFRRDLSATTGARVVREWRRLLVESRLGDRPMGADGATAVFRSFFDERGLVSRDAWSPKIGTPARKLWEIGDALCAFARGENENVIEKALALPAKETPEKPVRVDD